MFKFSFLLSQKSNCFEAGFGVDVFDAQVYSRLFRMGRGSASWGVSGVGVFVVFVSGVIFHEESLNAEFRPHVQSTAVEKIWILG